MVSKLEEDQTRQPLHVVDQTGIYFKGTDSNRVDYVTAALVGTDLASIQMPEHAHAVGAAAE